MMDKGPGELFQQGWGGGHGTGGEEEFVGWHGFCYVLKAPQNQEKAPKNLKKAKNIGFSAETTGIGRRKRQSGA